MARYEIHRTDANADALYGFLRAHGASVEVIDRPVDAAIGFHGVTVLAEVKQPKGKLEPGQQQFLSEFRGWVVVLRTEDDCRELLNDMLKAARVARG